MSHKKELFVLSGFQNVSANSGWFVVNFVQVACFCTGFYFNFCSCNSCLWSAASMKGFNMFIIICFKLQPCMVRYSGPDHCCVGLQHLFWSKQKTQSKSTVLTTPQYFMWSVPLWMFLTSGNVFFLWIKLNEIAINDIPGGLETHPPLLFFQWFSWGISSLWVRWVTVPHGPVKTNSAYMFVLNEARSQ